MVEMVKNKNDLCLDEKVFFKSDNPSSGYFLEILQLLTDYLYKLHYEFWALKSNFLSEIVLLEEDTARQVRFTLS